MISKLYTNGQLKATLEGNDMMAYTLMNAISNAYHWDCVSA